jgi:N-acetylmuramoyl-L-alanine amidase
MSLKMRFFIFTIFCISLFSCKKFTSPPLQSAKVVPFFIPQEGAVRLPVLILDAGHGGEDPGAINDSIPLYEKDATRAIVDATIKYIDPRKIKVIQTRPGKENVHRHDRIKFANANRPNLLMTVHINSARDTTVNGFEVGYSDSLFVSTLGKDTIKKYNPFKLQLQQYSQMFMKRIATNFPEMKYREVAVRKDDIWMIYAVNYPSILVEFGFISNRKDATLLKNPEKIKLIGKTLAQGITEILVKK